MRRVYRAPNFHQLTRQHGSCFMGLRHFTQARLNLAMTVPPPPWHAHEADDYDRQMTTSCSQLLEEIVADPARRQSILRDPRKIHRELFAPFVPASYAIYAGNYRGLENSPLAHRIVAAASELRPGQTLKFCAPHEVHARTAELLQHTRQHFDKAPETDFGKLLALTHTFCWFGLIHPFLDGNGHIQRAMFATMATGFGYPLSKRFAIHPRPYDRLLALGLETFTLAAAGQKSEELGLVAEYLAFFLDGPFCAPRMNIGLASLYE